MDLYVEIKYKSHQKAAQRRMDAGAQREVEGPAANESCDGSRHSTWRMAPTSLCISRPTCLSDALWVADGRQRGGDGPAAYESTDSM